MSSQTPPNAPHARVRVKELIRSGALGVRSRPLRSLLAAVGIAIGIASVLAIVVISDAGRRHAAAEIDALGVDTLVVEPGQSVGDTTELPEHAAEVAETFIPAVVAASALYDVDANVRRSGLVPEVSTEGIVVEAIKGSDVDLLEAVHGAVASGRFLDEADLDLPMAVVGATAAERLAIQPGSALIDVSGTSFRVVGVMEEFSRINTNLNTVALIGYPIADDLFELNSAPDAVYVRVDERFVTDVRNVLASQIDPPAPGAVAVSRPSDALEAREILDRTLRNLLLGLGAVGAIVGAIGVANVTIVSVMERTGEVGLRRALGAKRVHIGTQFIIESVVLAECGGLLGVALGLGGAAAYSLYNGWPVLLPWLLLPASLFSVAGLGALAGVYPAWKAASMSPVDALRSGT